MEGYNILVTSAPTQNLNSNLTLSFPPSSTPPSKILSFLSTTSLSYHSNASSFFIHLLSHHYSIISHIRLMAMLMLMIVFPLPGRLRVCQSAILFFLYSEPLHKDKAMSRPASPEVDEAAAAAQKESFADLRAWTIRGAIKRETPRRWQRKGNNALTKFSGH